jgi:quercetin dioxygenase-like cupin family protein
MAIPHAQSGEIVDVRPLGPALATARTTTLVKSKTLEILRLVVPAGKEIPSHEVSGEVTLLCLEGMVGIPVDGDTRVLEAGQLLYLSSHESHAVRGIQDASVLVTILLR